MPACAERRVRSIIVIICFNDDRENVHGWNDDDHGWNGHGWNDDDHGWSDHDWNDHGWNDVHGWNHETNDANHATNDENHETNDANQTSDATNDATRTTNDENRNGSQNENRTNDESHGGTWTTIHWHQMTLRQSSQRQRRRKNLRRRKKRHRNFAQLRFHCWGAVLHQKKVVLHHRKIRGVRPGWKRGARPETAGAGVRC